MILAYITQFFVEGADFLNQLYIKRKVIFELTKRDFKIKYTENYFGLTWAILEPLAMMLILWFIFSFIRGAGEKDGVPFSVFLLSALVIFDFFNKALNQGTRSIRSFSFLIKHVNFRTAMLPIISIFSELIVHIIVLCIAITIFLFSGVEPSWYWIQIPYYLFAACFLLIGLTWLTAAIVLFVPDVFYIISITMRMLFFLTPIFWSVDMVPPTIAVIVKLNPLYYLVEGYRKSLIYHEPFWSDINTTISYWTIACIVFLIGIFVFKRLRPHFADVI